MAMGPITALRTIAVFVITVSAIVGIAGKVNTARLSVGFALAEGAVTKEGAHSDSGIVGQVVIRPIRPHATIGTSNVQPYQAKIEILDSNGKLVTVIESDADGNFRVPLAPGKYLLRPLSSGPYPRASEQTISVDPKTF